MPESDFVGTLTEDIAILTTPDNAPADPPTETSSETSDPVSPSEIPQGSPDRQELPARTKDSQQQPPTTERPRQDPDSKPQPTDKQQATEKPQPEFEKPQADAESLEEQFPGGTEQAAQIITKAGELDAVDTALQGGAPSDIAGVIMNAYDQTGAERFPDVVQLALNLLEDRAPQQFDALVNSYIGERLKADGTWTALEYIYAQAKENPQAVPELLDRLAAYFTRYGLGPYNENTEATYAQDFSRSADEHITEHLNADIQRQLPPGFNAARPELQAKFMQEVHSQIQRWAKGDPKLAEAVTNALRGGLSRRAGIKAVNLLLDKARAVIPGAVKLLINQPEYAVFRNAPPPPPIDDKRDTLTPELARQLSDKRIMGWRGPVARQRKQNTAQKQKVTRVEAKHMPFSRLLDEAVEVEQP